MTALYIVLIILAVIMLLFALPIDCVINVSYNDTENMGEIIVKYLFLKFKIFPSEKEAEEAAEDAEQEVEKEEPEKDKKDPAGVVKFGKTVYTEFKDDILDILNFFFRKTIRVKELNISSVFGTGDPMYTGIALGAANAAVYNAIGVIDRNMKLDKWHVVINGDFDKACIAAGVYMKIRTNCLYIIKLGIMVAILLLGIQKINRRIKENG